MKPLKMNLGRDEHDQMSQLITRYNNPAKQRTFKKQSTASAKHKEVNTEKAKENKKEISAMKTLLNRRAQ